MVFWEEENEQRMGASTLRPHTIAELLARSRRVEQDRRMLIASLVVAAALLAVFAAR